MKMKIGFWLVLLCFSFIANGQSLRVEGYVYAENNAGFLKDVRLTVSKKDGHVKEELQTNAEGRFNLLLEYATVYELHLQKQGFVEQKIELKIDKKDPFAADKTEYLSLEMERSPGYNFEATIAEWRPEDSETPVDAIEGATIEVYNKTKREQVLTLYDHLYHTFAFRMESGNHYTILVRKKGYFSKRIEADVTIDGCILCIEGVGITRPGIADNLTENNTMGVLGANISLQKITIEESVLVENIYFEYNGVGLRSESEFALDKLIALLMDNPHIVVEIGAHTDSRGSAAYNLKLSQARAEGVVAYLIEKGVDKSRLFAKGYGEAKPVNHCKDGVSCTELEYERNRRIEFKVIELHGRSADFVPLAKMMEKEFFETDLEKLMEQPVFVATQENTSTQPKADFMSKATPPPSPSKVVQTKTIVFSKQKEVAAAAPVKNHKVQVLAKEYTGFKIEILRTENELDASHSLFSEFGGVELDRLADNKFSYLIGGFSSRNNAEQFLKAVILPRYLGARVVAYESGKRL